MICNIKSCSYSICGVCNNINDFDCEYKDYRAIGSTEDCRKAVENQTPQKPIVCRNMMTKHISAICPICNYDVTNIPKYCPNCGKKLDWD